MIDAPPGLVVIPIELAREGSFAAIVTDPVDTALRSIAEAVESRTDEELNMVILLLQQPASRPETYALHEAAFHALRGIVGALTLELSGRLRLNIVRAASAASATPSLRYLARSEAAFVAGATLDLTGSFE